jgi:hypothetical protein
MRIKPKIFAGGTHFALFIVWDSLVTATTIPRHCHTIERKKLHTITIRYIVRIFMITSFLIYRTKMKII